MIKFVFLILFITSNLFAVDYFYTVIDKIEISHDSQEYKDYHDLKNTNLRDKKIKSLSIRITINKDEIKNQQYYLNVVSDLDSLVYTNTKFSQNKNNLHIKLHPDDDNILYFNYEYAEAKRGEFRSDVINEFEYLYLYPNEGILYGIAYGIIFSAFLYYLVIFFSTRIKAFLYYSIMQFFVLLSLISFVYVSFLSYPNQTFPFTQAIIDIFETSAFLFTLLFAQKLLQTKKIMPNINILLNVFILLNILDIVGIFIFEYSILYRYMSFVFAFLVPALVGVVAMYYRVKLASIYTFGWIIMCVLVYVADKQIISISGIYTIHIVAPVESLIFSFALGVMLKNLVDKQNEQEKFLIHKSKLASMGEMINNIAHQWKQPLTHLGYINMNLKLASTDAVFDIKYLNEKLIESDQQIDFMSNTIDNFRDFYKPAKDKNKFLISTATQKSFDIMRPLLQLNGIELDFNIKKDSTLSSYENEYSQVVLNLISNAKDELLSRNVPNPTIKIIIDVIEGKSVTTVHDNAGGIREEKIEKIFEPYFTTKELGSGIGLYMSKTIIDSHFKGKLEVHNTDKGACFSIIV